MENGCEVTLDVSFAASSTSVCPTTFSTSSKSSTFPTPLFSCPSGCKFPDDDDSATPLGGDGKQASSEALRLSTFVI